jgi:hypothetical protein
LNIILSSVPRSTQWFLPSRFHDKNLKCIIYLLRTFWIRTPFHRPRSIILVILMKSKLTKPLAMKFSQFCYYFYRLFPDSRFFRAWHSLEPWRWRRHVPRKHRLKFDRLHGVISQKTEIFVSHIPFSTLFLSVLCLCFLPLCWDQGENIKGFSTEG